MTKIRPDVIRRALLAEAVILHAEQHHLTTDQLAAHFDVKRNTLYNILKQLREENSLHQVSIPKAAGRGGKSIVWVAGPNPNGHIADEKSVYQPKRDIRKSWPLNHVRDELVSFLFGRPEVCHG